MAVRYKVARQKIRFNKQTYHVGEFLPESFSERDLYKVLYPSRIEKVIVPELATTATNTSAATVSQGATNAVKSSAAPITNNGASLSANPLIQK